MYKDEVQICMLETGKGLTRVGAVDGGLKIAWDVQSKPRVYRALESWLVKASRRCRRGKSRLQSGAEGRKTWLMLE
jgi:hypothetical protein